MPSRCPIGFGALGLTPERNNATPHKFTSMGELFINSFHLHALPSNIKFSAAPLEKALNIRLRKSVISIRFLGQKLLLALVASLACSNTIAEPPIAAAIKSPCVTARSTPPPSLNWAGKQVLWLGTSIPHQGRGKDSYPEQFCGMMGCVATNNSFSGSHIRWFEQGVDESCNRGRNAPKGLSATSRELLEKIRAAAPDDGTSSYDESCSNAVSPISMGYEQRINAPWSSNSFDVVVIDHGHNDRILDRTRLADGLGTLNPTPLKIEAIHKGSLTEISLPANHGLMENDDITIRTPGIPRLDYWTGEVGRVDGNNIAIRFDSNQLPGEYTNGGTLVKYDKTKIFDAFNLIISDIYHMNALHGGNKVTVILMTPPTEWTKGKNDGSIANLNVSICELAAKWQLPFYNMTEDLRIGPDNLRIILPDTVHPTTAGSREFIARHIAAWASPNRPSNIVAPRP